MNIRQVKHKSTTQRSVLLSAPYQGGKNLDYVLAHDTESVCSITSQNPQAGSSLPHSKGHHREPKNLRTELTSTLFQCHLWAMTAAQMPWSIRMPCHNMASSFCDAPWNVFYALQDFLAHTGSLGLAYSSIFMFVCLMSALWQCKRDHRASRNLTPHQALSPSLGRTDFSNTLHFLNHCPSSEESQCQKISSSWEHGQAPF